MSFWRLFSAVLPCSHPHVFRERRKLNDQPVMHFVCERCGHAAPCMERTEREHADVIAHGAIRPSRAVVAPKAARRKQTSKPKADVYVLPTIRKSQEGA